MILVAGEGARPRRSSCSSAGATSGAARPGAPDLTDAIRGRVDVAVSTADVPVLTDDYAPTDALLLLFG